MSRIVGLLICLGTITAGAAFIAGIVLLKTKSVKQTTELTEI